MGAEGAEGAESSTALYRSRRELESAVEVVGGSVRGAGAGREEADEQPHGLKCWSFSRRVAGSKTSV